MNTKSVIKLGIALVLIVAVSVIGFSGIVSGKYTFMSAAEAVRGDADLNNGISAAFRVNGADDEQNALALDILTERFNMVYPTADCLRAGKDVLRVTSSDKGYESYYQNIGTSPWKIEFALEDGTVAITGDDIASVSIETNQTSGYYYNMITLTEEGARKYGDFSAAHIGQTLSVNVDGQGIVNVTVSSANYSGRIPVYTSTTSADDSANGAYNIYLYLSMRELPCESTCLYVGTDTALAGEGAMCRLSTAAGIALAVIAVALIVFFKVNGFFAALLALVTGVLDLYVVALLQKSFTASSVIGLFAALFIVLCELTLTLTMIRREGANGRTAAGAVTFGIKAARPLVIDLTLVTAVAAAFIMYFGGTGSVAFGQTLLFGSLIGCIAVCLLTGLLMGSFAQLRGTAKA